MTKLEKVIEEIAKTKVKLSQTNARLRELEKQKIEAEDDEVAAFARANNLTSDTLAAMLKTYHAHEPKPPESPAKTQVKEETFDDD